MKKIVISQKEYAKICLECPYSKCIGTITGCQRTRKYKVLKEGLKEDEKNND